MLGLDRNTARQTWTVVFILLLCAVIYLIREAIFIFVVSLLFAYLLWPLVKFLDRRLPGASRAWALAIVYLSLISILTVIGISIGSRIVAEASTLGTKAPELLAKFQQSSPAASVSKIQTARARVTAAIQGQISAHSREILAVFSTAVLDVLSHAGRLVFIVLVPILSFFFLKDGDQIRRSVLKLAAVGPRGDRINRLAAELNVLFAQYMRALVVLAGSASVAYGLFFSLVGVPYGILLAAIAFPLEFIPMIGPLIGATVVVAVAALGGFPHLLWIIAFLAIYRIFQDYILSPRLLSEGMELHPLLVIFGVLAGAAIAGVAGSFLSVPVMATLRIVFRQFADIPATPEPAAREIEQPYASR